MPQLVHGHQNDVAHRPHDEISLAPSQPARTCGVSRYGWASLSRSPANARKIVRPQYVARGGCSLHSSLGEKKKTESQTTLGASPPEMHSESNRCPLRMSVDSCCLASQYCHVRGLATALQTSSDGGAKSRS